MFKIDIRYDDKNPQGFLSVATRIMAFKERLTDEISKKLLEFGIRAQATSKKDYLSGPRPDKLGVVTGRLRSSIALKFKKEENVSQIDLGSNVDYAPVHELGFTGTVSIRSFIRRIRSRDVKQKQFSFKNKSGLKTVMISKGTGTVRAHTRNVNIKARPFLMPAVKDHLGWLIDNLRGLGGAYANVKQ